MCKDFGAWQRLNRARPRDPEAVRRARVGSIVHLNFVAELYEQQIASGHFFVHEHPLHADSWTVPSIARLLRRSEVVRVHGDQCQLGAEVASGSAIGHPIKKPIGFMSNSSNIALSLEFRCVGQEEEEAAINCALAGTPARQPSTLLLCARPSCEAT